VLKLITNDGGCHIVCGLMRFVPQQHPTKSGLAATGLGVKRRKSDGQTVRAGWVAVPESAPGRSPESWKKNLEF